MHFSQILAIASSVALVAAAPAPAPILIGEDDVILYGKDGRFKMMKRDDLEELKKLQMGGVVPPMPGYLDENLITFNASNIAPTTKSEGTGSLTKRSTSLVVPLPSQRFLGWDVQTSQIGKGPSTVTISTGFNIANSITTGKSTDITLVKDFLSVTESTDYSTQWTSTQAQTFAATVPKGKYGCFVTNAWTTRVRGNVWTGSIGGEGSLTYYQADSFVSKTYGDMTWVDGVISLCTGNSFPLHRCLGEGTL